MMLTWDGWDEWTELEPSPTRFTRPRPLAVPVLLGSVGWREWNRRHVLGQYPSAPRLRLRCDIANNSVHCSLRLSIWRTFFRLCPHTTAGQWLVSFLTNFVRPCPSLCRGIACRYGRGVWRRGSSSTDRPSATSGCLRRYHCVLRRIGRIFELVQIGRHRSLGQLCGLVVSPYAPHRRRGRLCRLAPADYRPCGWGCRPRVRCVRPCCSHVGHRSSTQVMAGFGQRARAWRWKRLRSGRGDGAGVLGHHG